MKRVPSRERKQAVERAMGQAGVTEVADTLIQHLSKGYRQRTGIADALVSNPPLLILDEPTAGLDPNQIREVRRLVKELGETHTILLSTHILSEVESTCQRAIVINRGRLVAEGTLEELRGHRRSLGATLLLRGEAKQARELCEATAGVRRARVVEPTEGEVFRLTVSFEKKVDDGPAVLERCVSALVGAGFGVREAAPTRATLEEVFAELTRAESSEAGEDEGSEEDEA